MNNFSICIQNLGLYNEGVLAFEWLELPASDEKIAAALDKIKVCHEDLEGNKKMYCDIFGCPYEEYHIPDAELPEGVKYSEYATIGYYNQIAEQLESLEDYEKEQLAAYIEATGYDFDYCLDHYENSIYYPGYSLDDVAQEEYDNMLPANAPEFLTRYFDFEAFARDLDYDGYTEVSNGVIYTY